MVPPLIGFRLRENAAGHGPRNVSAEQKLKKIVGNGDSAVRNGDVGHSNVAEKAGKTPANPTILHSVAKGKSDLASSPDLIIVGTTEQDREAILGNEQWRQLKAVRQGRVYVNPKGVYSWDRHDAEEALQIQWAAKTLYPDKFRSLDIVKETKEFYKTFFEYNLTDAEVNDILVPHARTGYGF
jgi:iron complex transport system substrate-binding protein